MDDHPSDPPASRPSGPWVPPTPEEMQAILPQYEIVKMLGRGGMGAVYMGRQISLDRPVAIKILSGALAEKEGDFSFAERFKNEARAMAKLSHPGIVAVHDFGETADGLLYIVMEYIDGTDVARMIAADGRLHTEHAMAIAAHVCDALAYAHSRGIIHRDIKPANIMVGYDGVVKVADFGLAKVHASAGEQSLGLTMSGMVMGTMHFMAPESMEYGAIVDHRADLYAVGVMLYQMLTGKVPRGMFELPSMQIQGLDPRYDGIVARAMQEDREERYQSAGELRQDLDAILTQPVVKVEAEDTKPAAALPTMARPQRPGGKGGRAPARPAPAKPRTSPAWVAVPVLLLLAGAGAWWYLGREEPAPVAEQVSPSTNQTSQPGPTLPAKKDAPTALTLQNATPPETPSSAPPTDKTSTKEQPPASPKSAPPVAIIAPKPVPAIIPSPNPPVPPSTAQPPPPALLPELAQRLAAYLAARRQALDGLGGRYATGLDSRLAQAANAADLPLATAFQEEKARVESLRASLAQTPEDTAEAARQWPALPVLAEDTPAKLAELRQVWEAEYGKIRADLDGKLSQSLQALEADLTRARRLDEARTVLAYREGLPPSENASPATAPSRADTPTSGFVDLFSESGQKEWRQSGDGGIDFKDGVGTTRFSAGDQGAFGVAWYAKRTFRDFIYEVEFRAMQPRFNSGLRLRFPRLGREPMKATEEGYEVAITDTESDIAYPTGSIHGFQQATSSPLKRLGEWNTLSVEVVGQSYTVTLNGQVVARFTGSRRAEGYIGIENHRRGAVQFRNVRIKEIAPGQGAAAPAQPSAPDGTLAAATKGQPFANSLGMKFVPVPETKVLFCIHETRQKDYAAYAAENPGTNGFWRNLSYEGHRVTERVDDHPVGTVNWHDATDFCRWLSEKEGLTYRLPTDEEWSMAVGLGGKERRRRDDVPATLSGGVAGEYPWGSEWPPPANAGNYADESFIANAPSMGDNYLKGYDDGFPTTAPVMSFAPNRFGLYDMGGNQQEWIGDWYDAGQSRRLLRGAGWAAGRNSHLLSSFRIAADASDGRYTHGFRVVVELP